MFRKHHEHRSVLEAFVSLVLCSSQHSVEEHSVLDDQAYHLCDHNSVITRAFHSVNGPSAQSPIPVCGRRKTHLPCYE